MKRILFFSSILLILFTAGPGCKKNSNLTKGSSESDLIDNARQFFTQRVSPIALSDQGLSRRIRKTPVWTAAHTIQLSVGQAVIVPLSYEKNITITPGLSRERTFPLARTTRLLIYTGKDRQYHAVVLTAIPDAGYNPQNSKSFSGMIVTEDWAGNAVKNYKFSPDGKIYTRARSGTSLGSGNKMAEGQKAPATIIETCYYWTTCVGPVDNPYDDCNTESLGCSDEYIDDFQSPDDGSGGGGGGGGDLSGGDAGGAGSTTYQDPNSFSGQPCRTTPNLSPNGSKTHAATVNTGVFTLANVGVEFDFDPVTSTLDQSSVKTNISDGFIVGTYAQTTVTNVFTSNNEINFMITATVTIPVPLFPGGQFVTTYDMIVQYNVATNTCYFSNTERP